MRFLSNIKKKAVMLLTVATVAVATAVPAFASDAGAGTGLSSV